MTKQNTTDTLTKVVFWPSPQDYCESLQTPQESLACPDLRDGEIELDNLGLPRPISGGFASVYKVVTANSERAVRCFLVKRADQHERYSLISEHLNANPLPYTVDFDYLAEGIKVGKSWFPIVDMDWVQGETLDQYLRTHYRDSTIVSEVRNEFVKMMTALRAAGIAHGDLQHGNILVMPDRTLKLVDYDGMFVSSMSGMKSCELGHRNYQHPLRTSAHFDANLDNFSALTIFTTLKAIEADPRLVERLDALNECSFFRASDFKDPLASKAFHVLERHKNEELGKLSRLIRQYLEKDPGAVPALTDLPSEPDEYVFSLSTISADLLSPDFLYAEQGEDGSLAEELIQEETDQTITKEQQQQEEQQEQEQREEGEEQQRTKLPPSPPSPGSQQSPAAPTKANTLGSKLSEIFVVIFMTVWFGGFLNFTFHVAASFLPADRSKLPSQFEQVFSTPLKNATVRDYKVPRGKVCEFTVECTEPLKIKDEQTYTKSSVNSVLDFPWAKTLLLHERHRGNISILLDQNRTTAHIDMDGPQLFAVTRDGVNIERAMKLPAPSDITVVDKYYNDPLYKEEEAKGLTVDHSGVTLRKHTDPTALTPEEFEGEIRGYLRKLQSAPVDREMYSDPSYVLELVMPDRSLSNEQIKVLERIFAELKAASPDKHRIWLKVIVPVKPVD